VKKAYVILVSLVYVSILQGQDLPIGGTTLFSGSGNCENCHQRGANVFETTEGEDISPISLWRSTMMANSAKDPFWQAKVSAEVNQFPAMKTVIEDKCTTCHAPMGRTESAYHSSTPYSIEEMLSDPLSMDGVSCTSCHQIADQELGQETSFSGGYTITDERMIYGPYESPLAMPMWNQVGFTPAFSAHVNESELCATCHTLYTPYVDRDGQIQGYFPEQVPYLEWLNSNYPAEDIQCQTCHMPSVDQAMKISNLPPWNSTLRSPVWKHDFVGANLYMNDILTKFTSEIGVTASESDLSVTASKTAELLNQNTVDLIVSAEMSSDTITIDVKVVNLAGHKFPTGFPSRRAWIHLTVTNEKNQVVYESGKWNDEGEIYGEDINFEPHHTLIHNPDQVQIYEAVMHDLQGDVTCTLLYASGYLKDNRIPPKGFTSKHESYQSMAVFGDAAADPDFNRDISRSEGNGADMVRYEIPVVDKGSVFTIIAEMRYQTISPDFSHDLFAHDTGEVGRFKGYYTQTPNIPVLVKSVSIEMMNTKVGVREDFGIDQYVLLRNYPNPFNASTTIEFVAEQEGYHSLEIYDMVGRNVKTLLNQDIHQGVHRVHWEGDDFQGEHVSSGVYFASLGDGTKKETIRLLYLR
jgi:hypothetical protein